MIAGLIVLGTIGLSVIFFFGLRSLLSIFAAGLAAKKKEAEEKAAAAAPTPTAEKAPANGV